MCEYSNHYRQGLWSASWSKSHLFTIYKYEKWLHPVLITHMYINDYLNAFEPKTSGSNRHSVKNKSVSLNLASSKMLVANLSLWFEIYVSVLHIFEVIVRYAD